MNRNVVIKQYKNTKDTGFGAKFFDFGADDVDKGIPISDAIKQLKAIQNMTADKYREIKRIVGSGNRTEIYTLSDIEREIGYGSYIGKALGIDVNSSNEDFRSAQKQAKSLLVNLTK